MNITNITLENDKNLNYINGITLEDAFEYYEHGYDLICGDGRIEIIDYSRVAYYPKSNEFNLLKGETK